jgi:two-component system nitrate/nitrite response regulator NarL
MRISKAAKADGSKETNEPAGASGRRIRVAAPTAARPQFLVVEDREDFGTTLTKTLRRWGDVTWARNFEEAVAAFSTQVFSALIVDVRLPGRSGFDVLEEFRAMHPSTPAMVLTGFFAEADSVRACELGAQYVAKPITTAGLETFFANAAGTAQASSPVYRKRKRHEAEALDRLSAAERKVYERLAAGDRNEEIGRRLFISVETVRTHVRRVFAKLGAHSRTEAVAIAQQRHEPPEPQQR